MRWIAVLRGREPVRGTGKGIGTPIRRGLIGGRAGMPMALPVPSRIFTIFEGTSEIQRMIIGRAVTGLDVR